VVRNAAPAVAAPEVVKPSKVTKSPAADPSVDDEHRKALKALQDSQLETSF
jgi:hypothetical protein